jgi:ankyrin repeat protein
LKGKDMRKVISFFIIGLWIVVLILPAYADDPSNDLDWAIAKGEIEEVKKILSEHPELADVPFVKRSNWRPLQWAAINRHVDIVEYLLELGVDVDARNNDGETALLIVTTDLDADTDIAKVLINYGANVNTRDSDGLTPLKNATQIGNEELVKLLREHGAKE